MGSGWKKEVSLEGLDDENEEWCVRELD